MILVAAGFGERGTRGKIAAVPFRAREKNVPFFGICFGMQMAVIESARNLLGLSCASFHRIQGGEGDELVVGLLTEWARGNEIERRMAGGDLGGVDAAWAAYPGAVLAPGSSCRGDVQVARRTLRNGTATDDEVNVNYKERLGKTNMRFSGRHVATTACCLRSVERCPTIRGCRLGVQTIPS